MVNQLTFSKNLLAKNKTKKEHSLFRTYDPLGVKLLMRHRLQFIHLNEQKFRHGFSDAINPMCGCGTEVETTEHLLLRSHFYSAQRLELFENLQKVDLNFLKFRCKK